MRRFICTILLFFAGCTAVFAQQDSTGAPADTPQHYIRMPRPMTVLDSVAHAMALEEKIVGDSLAMVYLRRPDSNSTNLFVDSILRSAVYSGNHYLDLASASKTKPSIKGYGHVRPSRDPWVIAVIVVLILFIPVLNIYSAKDMSNVFLAFYYKRTNTQAGKEDSPINAWTFIGLFLLFGFTLGIFLYLLTTGYYKVYYPISGIQLFGALSAVIISLFAVKFLVLKFLGFVFDINKVVSEYIKALSLTYFNITFVFLPVALCFSLIADKFFPYLLAITLLLTVIIFIWQYLRSSVGIISNFRFHKFYLFTYLCALEICPILILVKALNIGFK
ncbi:DUF4271 domain-containing protein [Mucilaginibacter psychrotolerans]|uniref:DUF4271 domain-containing protein n=1 Tax=Mucilaginibacter psychrotolerans TaxID=1524096 RepID=A0A4Y8SQE0_9SPHI|nr:DUF4271 domain-containing protein [Mucilaginibacter psychrotolerans]TFF40747.1 DUF4271 domain-containing protein [Mucilaginibacter psychrotolerans]